MYILQINFLKKYNNCFFLIFNRVAVIGKKFEGIADQEEKWYGTKYKLEKIEKNILDVSKIY